MTPPPETATATQKQTVTITVDGKDIEARPGELLIAAAERHGTYIPRFCYHPRMAPVGMCRMCLVNVEGPRGTSMQVSCMLTVNEGMKVDTQAPEVKKAQDGVLEFLLINHPLDCPVCDKGGECPLQDQTMAFGPGETRFIEEKRHFEKPIQLSPLVAMDRERCILCDRCTRFSKEIAGDPLISFQGRGNQTQVNVFPGHPFASYFSGNTVQICPVGALTSISYRFKARPWDLEQVESTCTSCSVGCRVAVQSSGNELTRYLGIDAEPTNHGWMCDKGRYDYEAINSEARLSAPLMSKDNDGSQVEVSWGEALAAAASAIKASTPQRIGFIGGARLPNEDQYLWTKLAKGLVGTDNVDAQLADGLPAEAVLGVPRATIDQACNAELVILLAPDLKEELPVFYLRLREAVLARGLKVLELSPQPTSFSKLAAATLAYRTGDAAAVAQALTAKSEPDGEVGGLSAESLTAARQILAGANDVVVVAGRQNLAESGQGVADAIGFLAKRPNVRFLPGLRRSNVMGALDMGLAPGVLPGRVSLDDGRRWFTEAWGNAPAQRGMDTAAMIEAAAAGELDVLVLLGADPLMDFPSREQAAAALANVPTVVAIDILPNRSVLASHIVLPAAGYAERAGTTTNIEGRVTRLGQKTTPPGVAWPDWMIATELAAQLGGDLSVESLEDIWDEIEALAPSHARITREVLNAKTNRDGVVAPYAGEQGGESAGSGVDAIDTSSGATTAVPGALDPEAWPGVGEVEWQGDPDTQTAMSGATTDKASAAQVLRPSGVVPPLLAYSVTEPSPAAPIDGYAVRLVAGRKLYDQGTLVQHSPHLATLASSAALKVHPSTLAPLGIESGGLVRVVNAAASVVMTVETDDRIARGTAVLPFNVDLDGAGEFIDATTPVTNVRIETP